MRFVLGTKEAEKPTTRANRRAQIWTLVATASVIVAGAVAVVAIEPALTGPPAGSADASSSPAPSPAPPAPPTEPSALDAGAAEDVIETVLETVATTAPSSDPSIVLANLAGGGYLAEIDAQYQELAANGWTMRGNPTIESTAVVSMDAAANPVTAVVSACIDSSDVTMLDLAGVPVGGQSTPRSTHLFGLVQEADGTWKITSHWFPNDPAC